MRILLPGILVIAALCASPRLAVAGCGANPGDIQAVADARAQVTTDCDCAGAASHGEYVSCAAGVANERASAGTLPQYCKGAVKKCAARSTCGKPGFVACCRTSGSGKTKCSVKRDSTTCTAAGNACTADPAFTSCCDACTESGCVVPPAP